MTLSEDGDDLLHREAALFGRHLVGRAPGEELCARYVAAHRALLGEPVGARDRAILEFLHGHPGTLPFLDAAAGVLAPRSLLRRKVLLMTAVLEATPDFVDDFLPRTVSAPAFFVRCAWLGALALGKAAVGALLWPYVVGARGAAGGRPPA